MNILIAATNLKRGNGGVCTHILDLCREYIRMGHRIVLIADGTDFQQEINCISSLIYIDMPLLNIRKSPVAFFRAYKRVQEVCTEHRINIVHLHGQSLIPLAWLVRLSSKIPFLWTNHIDEFPGYRIMELCQKTMKFPIISVSSDLKLFLESKLNIKGDQIHVVNNGIDLNKYFPISESERTELRKKYSVKKEEFLICELARLNYGKGQDMLVRAVKRLRDLHPEHNIKILFAGAGDINWFEENVEKYALENGIPFEFVGFQSPRDIFGIADLAVIPSLFEGFSIACVEALAMQCPVVRSNTPGYSDMTDITLVHEKGSIEDLSCKLEYALLHHEEMKLMAHRGRMKCETTFNVSKMAEETIKIYCTMLKV